MYLADKPQHFCKLAHDAYSFFKPLFFKLLPIMLIHALLSIGVFSMKKISNVYPSYTNEAIFTVSFIIYVILIAYLLGVMFIRADGVLSGDTNKTACAWCLGKKVTLKLIGMELLLFLMSYGIFSIAIFLMTFLAAFSTELGIATFVITIPVIFYLIVRMIFAIPLVACREEHVFSAIAKSFYLSKGNFWKIVGIFFVAVLIPAFGFFVMNVIITYLAIEESLLFSLLYTIIYAAESLILPVLFISSLLVLLNDGIHRRAATDTPVKSPSSHPEHHQEGT